MAELLILTCLWIGGRTSALLNRSASAQRALSISLGCRFPWRCRFSCSPEERSGTWSDQSPLDPRRCGKTRRLGDQWRERGRLQMQCRPGVATEPATTPNVQRSCFAKIVDATYSSHLTIDLTSGPRFCSTSTCVASVGYPT